MPHHSTTHSTPTHNKNITLLQWNVRGVPENWSELKQALISSSKSIICLQESHLKPSDPYNFEIATYSLIRKDALFQPLKRRGGVCTYIKSNIAFREIQITTTFDIQAFEISTNQNFLTVINTYAPPDINFSEFIQDLETLVTSLTSPFILCGDFNAHHPLWDRSRRLPDSKGKILLELVDNLQLVINNDGSPTLPARTTTHSDTTPDITATSSTLALSTTWETSPDPYFSDHLPIHITLGHTTTQHRSYTRFNLKKADWYSFTNTLENVIERQPTPEQFIESITETAKLHIPQTKPNNNAKPKSVPWWNYDCQRAITFRNTARHRYEKSRSEEDFINYKKAKARCRKVIKQAKRTSFEELANSFNRFTPLSKIWGILKAFKGLKTSTQKATYIIHNNNTFTNPQEISEQFSNFYRSISSSIPPPLPLIIPEETTTEVYNLPFTLYELDNAINRTGNSCPGPDQIHYHLFKNLGQTAKLALLYSLNYAFSSHSYPENWFHAHIIPINKPNKDPTKLSSYRPISLTNTIHKIFERIIKNRLLYIIEKQNLISPNQCGFLPGRSTLDNLVKITADIRNAFHSKQYTAALFLDLKNAYDTLNIQPLLDYLKNKINGHLLHYLNTYLTKRSFQVKFLNHISDPKTPTSGLMQGSVLSPLLFILALNITVKSVPAPSKIAIYADDIAIWSSHKSSNTALNNLDRALKTVQNNLRPLNLHISSEKTQCVIFGSRKPINPLPLQIDNSNIEIRNDAKFLGIILDRGLTFRLHIEQISTRARKRINILKALSGTDFGGDRKTLLNIYKSIIRPILEYASIIFENIAKTHLQKLDVIQNTCLRIITSAYRTTPTQSLHIYNNISTLTDRRTESLLRYFHKIQKTNNHPCIPYIKYRSHRRYTNNIHQKTSYGSRITTLTDTVNITLHSPPHTNTPVAWWASKSPQVILLIDQPKHMYTNIEIQALHHQIISEHLEYTFFYTDGSKNAQENKTAAAVVSRFKQEQTTILKTRLPGWASIFSAELYAILAAYAQIKLKNISKSMILSDSLSAITSIHEKHLNSHPLIKEIIKLQSQIVCPPKLVWIPSHTGIHLNEKADELAKDALNQTNIGKIPYSSQDFLSLLKNKLNIKCQLEWDKSKCFLRKIQPEITVKTKNQNSKLQEMCLARLRLGHSYLTHSYLLLKSDPPNCSTCNSRTTVKHILIECQNYNQQRQELQNYCLRNNLSFNITTLLNDQNPDITKLLLKFIFDSGIFRNL